MELLRSARKDNGRLCGHCEECSDEAIALNLTFAIGSFLYSFLYRLVAHNINRLNFIIF